MDSSLGVLEGADDNCLQMTLIRKTEEVSQYLLHPVCSDQDHHRMFYEHSSCFSIWKKTATVSSIVLLS